MPRTLALSLFVLLIVIALPVAALSQVQTGFPPFSSSQGGIFDTVDLANLNVHFAIPIFSRAGRGVPFTYAMQYDSSIYFPSSGRNPGWTTCPVNSPKTKCEWGWTAESLRAFLRRVG